jgi:2',3'-cyclic-nucleotide 2'-phosphodiesterase (5'-nucleotidase family)
MMMSEMPTLRIVSINDVYSLDCLPRFKSLVAHWTAQPADRTIVVLAGDFVAPSLLSSLDAGRGMVDCLDDIGVTYVIFGNHEDDVAPAELHRRIAQFDGTWLSTNLRFDDATKSRDVIDVGGARVGLVGVVMADAAVYRAAPFGGAPIEQANASALHEASRLIEEGCVFVVPITHQTMDDDRALARAQVSPAFPVIVGGHEHTPFLERVGATWIVKAGMDASAAVITEISWTDAKSITTTARLEPVAGYAEDVELRARVDDHMNKVKAIEDATLVMLAPGEKLSSVGARRQQTSLGALLCSRMRDALGADMCLFNAGGVRGNREYTGRFTYGDLKTEVPFDNEMVVVSMSGRTVRDAVTASRAHAPNESGSFLQVDDALDLSKLDDAREYRVATVRNLLAGMDHLEPFVRFAAEHPERVPPVGSGRDVKHVLVDAFAVELWRKLGGFDEIDANHDGMITEPEIAAALARVTASAPSHVTAKILLHAIDANSDERVSPSELERATRR